MIKFVLSAWKVCQTCGGSGQVPNPKNGGGSMTCPACNGAGGIDTKNIVIAPPLRADAPFSQRNRLTGPDHH